MPASRIRLRNLGLDRMARRLPLPAVPQGRQGARHRRVAERSETPDNGLRQLEFKKNQYGPLGATITLRYKDGLFLPEYGPTTAEKLAKDALARQVFVHLVEQFSEQRRNVSHTPNANNYAPAVFAKEKKSKDLKLRKQDFEEAMRDLFNQGRIAVEEYGKASNLHTRLVRRPAQTHSSDRL